MHLESVLHFAWRMPRNVFIACRLTGGACIRLVICASVIDRSLPMDCPAVAVFRQRLEASMPSRQIEEMRRCIGAPYMDCIDLAFDSFLLHALRNHVKQVQHESKTVDTRICKLPM